MAPLIVMLAGWLVARAIGAADAWSAVDSWVGALRVGLATMFAFTAVSHFHPRSRQDLIRMVPTGLPAPALLVTATGLLELVGAIALLVPSTRTGSRLRIDRASRCNVSGQCPGRSAGIGDRGTPRHAARVAPAASVVLDCRTLVGPIGREI